MEENVMNPINHMQPLNNKTNGKKSKLIIALIIILIVVSGLWYILKVKDFQLWSKAVASFNPATSDPVLDQLKEQGDSDDIASIIKDLNNTDIESLAQ